jgi:hypothetical protein
MKKGIIIALIYLFLASYICGAVSNQTATAVQTATPVPEQKAQEPALIVQPEAAPKPNLIVMALASIRSKVTFVLSRDYPSACRNLFKWFLNLNILVKAVAIIIFLVLLVILWNYTFRNSRANNLRRARKHHLMGEKAHKNEDEDRAKYHYNKAQEYREKAQEQW